MERVEVPLAHQAGDSLAMHRIGLHAVTVALAIKQVAQHAATGERVVHVQLIDPTHQR